DSFLLLGTLVTSVPPHVSRPVVALRSCTVGFASFRLADAYLRVCAILGVQLVGISSQPRMRLRYEVPFPAYLVCYLFRRLQLLPCWRLFHWRQTPFRDALQRRPNVRMGCQEVVVRKK